MIIFYMWIYYDLCYFDIFVCFLNEEIMTLWQMVRW